MTTCTVANPELIHEFYEFQNLDLVYLDKNLTELSYFPQEIKNVLRTFQQKPLFVKFYTIPPEKDEATSTHYLAISLIQLGYISENFELNIEATRKFEPFRFNESYINYRRTSGAFAVKSQGDRFYTSRLRSLYGEPNFIIISKEDMQEGVRNNDFLKFSFQLEPGNFKETPVVLTKFAELIRKEEERQASLHTAKILPP